MNRETDIDIFKLGINLETDFKEQQKRIKSVCEKAYDNGYADGVNNGFTWTLTKDKLPEECELKLVTIRCLNDWEDFYSKTTFGYYHKDDWYVEGWLSENEVIAWANLPKAYKPKEEDD